MPRERRIWEPGDLLSIAGRGHEGRPLFATEDDKRFFVDRLRRVFRPGDVDLIGWGLLINHYHLLIRVTDLPPDQLFRRLNTPIALRERRRCGDRGSIFQSRYWSRQCLTVGAELPVLLYVLGNPCRHGIVASAQDLELYEWSAYAEVLGLASPGLVDPRHALALLHPDQAVARAALRAEMEASVARWRSSRVGIDVCDEPGCRGVRDQCLLVHPARQRGNQTGIGLAATHVPTRADVCVRSVIHDRADRRAQLALAGWSPDDLVSPVCTRMGVAPDAVLAGCRRRAECAARAVIACVACDGVGVPAVVVAQALGLSEAAVSQARARGGALLAAREWSFDDVLSWRSSRT